MHPESLANGFQRLAKAAGLPAMPFHSLRHTHATLMLQADVPAKVVQERLGHSSIGVTINIYSHVVPGMQEDAMAGFDAALRASMEVITRIEGPYQGNAYGFPDVNFFLSAPQLKLASQSWTLRNLVTLPQIWMLTSSNPASDPSPFVLLQSFARASFFPPFHTSARIRGC